MSVRPAGPLFPAGNLCAFLITLPRSRASFAIEDFDCDVDQADYALFETCASGPGYTYASGGDDRDFDSDGDIDQSDFAIFQRCYSGENVPADPNCAS